MLPFNILILLRIELQIFFFHFTFYRIIKFLFISFSFYRDLLKISRDIFDDRSHLFVFLIYNIDDRSFLQLIIAKFFVLFSLFIVVHVFLIILLN
jgi:hypothetical protein